MPNGSPSHQPAERPFGDQTISGDQFRDLIEFAPIAMVVVDEEGRIALANRQAEHLFGYAAGELTGSSVEMLIPERLRRIHMHKRAEYHAEMAPRAMTGERQLIGLHKDGTELPLEIGLGPVHVGTRDLVCATLLDIGPYRRAENALSQALEREKQAAAELERLGELKNALLLTVSHDLRTPLTAIRGFAEVLNHDRAALPEASRRYLTRIIARTEEMVRTLDDLLDVERLSRLGGGVDRQRVEMAGIARKVLGQADLGDRPVHVELEDVVASVDAVQVERILVNLLANATRHTKAGTQIWLRVRRAGGGVMLIVEDEGPGVPDDLKPHVFEAFRRGSNSTGTGVGLSLVSRFAALHGGHASVEDRPGGGASFRVWLPDSPHDGPAPTGS